jgi:peptide/nickel transport system substrate-binding protein
MLRSEIARVWIVCLALVVACAPTSAPGPAATAAPESLTIAMSENADSLDAHLGARSAAKSVINHIFEALIDRDPKSMQPIPLLAASWTQPDPTTWVFKLRPGVKFTNGEAFDAAAVKWNFDRVIASGVNAGPSVKTLVKSIDVVDASTVRIVTTSPAAYFLERLVNVWMMPPKDTQARGDAAVALQPVGTGPYKLAEWKQQQSITLTRNDEYWGKKPFYKTVQFREILESTTALSEFVVGTVDIVNAVDTDQVDYVNKSGRGKVVSVPSKAIVETMLDAMGRSGPTPFTDRRVRQAANYAVDREAIAKNLLGGYSQPVAGFVSPLTFGFDASLKPYPYDPAKAKALLAEAGYPNGFETVIKVYPLGKVVDSKTLAEAEMSYLQAVGIKASIVQVSSQEISAVVREGRSGPVQIRSNAGFFDAALSFSYYETNNPAAYYKPSAELERLRAQAASSTDPEERKRLYAQIGKIIYDDAPAIFGWAGSVMHAMASNVEYLPQADNVLRLYLAKAK